MCAVVLPIPTRARAIDPNGLMTWTDMLRDETLALLSQEDDVVPTLEYVLTYASSAAAHESLLALLEAAPGRQARLDVACSLVGWDTERRPARFLNAWEGQVHALLDGRERGPVTDAAILALVLKISRLRTAGYEVACLLAERLREPNLAGLLRGVWNEDRAADDRASRTFAALVGRDEDGWDAAYRMSQE